MSTYPAFDTMPIGTRWRAGSAGKTRASTDPYTGDTLTEIAQADEDDLNEAYRSAVDAQRDWADAPPGERAGVLRAAADVMTDRKDEIVDWLVRETGGTLAKAELEWSLVRSVMWEAAGMPHHVAGRIIPSDIPGKESRVYREPVGVVAVISPWNFPMQLSNRSVAPALAVGNAVVLKPAGDTPVTGGLLLARIFEEAGLPDGLLSVVVGSGSDIGDAIVTHPTPRVVSFTGSTPVGKGIAEKAGLKKLALELGGNGPFVVLDDADLELAVQAGVFGSFFHQGQICMIANRIIADAAIYDEFLDRFVAKVKTLTVGDPRDPDVQLGPIINSSQVESIQDKLQRARDDGAEVVLGGDPFGPTGQCLPPHVLTGTNDVATAREEVFGPVMTVIRADGEEDALRIANDTEYGLSSAVFSRDVERAVRFGRRIEAGMTHINDAPVNDDANTAFGGEKDSGIGRFGGQWAIDEFTTDHWVSVQHAPRTYAI
ncbi:aldehyde dehydrogenase [Mycolicibacterium duvalii]|uniref:Salicylaldehyde dehydrogenase n=1 Tax=Mycolicibacterium duvalii TaxID=39688 RepID=A0A7I7K4W4_9MYCO|nr:aldehyde dehydrogenase family protein [Mycolicibacterium duvalii]MCV7367766.1 aldehyde dehydrogenase family protein [Mycolicibacterium duvalii]PEG39412.1 aldehyde dehydrogenase [Mycolicibacterium duvalii]BBX18644.1 aldehyde dehydrogenase [Mycolicibacterium duvalii]